MDATSNSSTYPDRLETFSGYWDDNEATARQLAAIGHVFDRPPLEAIEEGSRCVSCSCFVKKDLSIRALEGNSTSNYEQSFKNFTYHRSGCIRLQVRIPLEPQATLGGLHGGFRMHELKSKWESRNQPQEPPLPRFHVGQTSSLFSLPTELRLQIYSMILPALDDITEIVPINRDSARVVTKSGQEKTGPRDLTKSNLLRTCKAIHNEALDLLFTNRVYRFANAKTLYLFLRAIGSTGRALLSRVDIYCGSREDAITFALLATCPKLRHLTLRMPRPRLLFPLAPIWQVDGVACLLALSGLEEVEFKECGASFPRFLREGCHDAELVRRELRRGRGERSCVRWVGGFPDL
ncbi:hypothetical protein KC354_g4180 [Hortaea werneckii]|uniref:F-box domain-containing protein n=1 Tax=Hortaea werneckii TaxID=91943 RepID=A0A3M7EMG5_HORWE|nr:hypothetical protein KC354_g4180 [Hortaea werneckii]RMY77670.1 hypothetical protein D0863_01143 [Hortaea werneckii]